jgi:hypothetical protein
MRLKFLAAAALAVAAVSPALAQPPEPTVELRVRSVNDLLDKVEYVAGLAGQEEAPKQFRELVKQLSADGKGVEGLDPKRPFGVYAAMTDDVVSSPVVIMVPIADKDRFLTMLKERAGIEPEKAGDTLKVPVPLIGELHAKFAHDYLYVGMRAADLDAKKLVTPKAFFANDDGSVASLLVRVDRVPAEVRKVFLGQFEMKLAEERKKKPEGESDAEFKLKNMVFDAMVAGSKGLLEDCKQLAVRLVIDAKTDELAAEVVVTPKAGTTAAKNFASLGAKTSLPAGIVSAKNTVARAGGKIELTADLKAQLKAVVDAMVEDELKKAGDRAVAEKIFDAITPTLKSGELDYALALTGPDANGKHGMMVAMGAKDAKEIEKLLKEFAPFVPEDAAKVTFDVQTIGGFALHKVEGKQIDENFEKIFGTKTFWVGVSDTCVVLSIEESGDAIKAALKAKPAATAAHGVELSAAKLIPLADNKLKPDDVKRILKQAFGDGPVAGKDTVSVSVEGGAQLSIKVKAKGQALRLMVKLEQYKGN